MKIPIITGYTASGKSELAIKLSEYIDIEIISADAYQVYKYMDIGTGKPTKDQLNHVKHHLIDILLPDEQYSAGIFFEHVESIIPDILSRKKIPLIVGGTGLYVETITKGIFTGPSKHNAFRDHMKKVIEEKGVAYAYELLKSKDPSYAGKISTGDTQKIIRALEIIHFTNMTVTDAHLKLHRHPAYQYNIYLISKDRKDLYELIDRRVKKMFEAGWIDEVTNLLNMGYTETLSSFKAIGYREIANYIKNGGSLDDLVADIQKKTRHFAKRQVTWFGHMKDLEYLDTEKLDIKSFAEKLAEQLHTI